MKNRPEKQLSEQWLSTRGEPRHKTLLTCLWEVPLGSSGQKSEVLLNIL